MFVVTVPVAFVPRLFVFAQEVKFAPPELVPQNNHTIVGKAPVEVTLPFMNALVLVIFVGAELVMTGADAATDAAAFVQNKEFDAMFKYVAHIQLDDRITF